jgi:hypothetical protein
MACYHPRGSQIEVPLEANYPCNPGNLRIGNRMAADMSTNDLIGTRSGYLMDPMMAQAQTNARQPRRNSPPLRLLLSHRVRRRNSHWKAHHWY